jgi:hypothetical protein
LRECLIIKLIQGLWYPGYIFSQKRNATCEKNGENSARPHSSIDRIYAETGPCCVTG